MGSNVFSPIAIDAIGEIFNISLGSSATAVSNMLARRVDITTPTVSVVSADEFTLGDLQPAIGVKIDYVAGLSGSNIMLLKRSDVREIVDILMGSTTKDEDFKINELNMSAICEVMNQMMGAASTAMSDFLNRMVNISTPQAFEIGSLEEFIDTYFPSSGILVIVRFKFSIEDTVESEFMSALSMDLVRELLKGFGIEGEDVGVIGEELMEKSVTQPAVAAESETSSDSGAPMSQEEIERLMTQSFAEEQAMQKNAASQPAASAEQSAQSQVAEAPAPQQTPVQPVAQPQQEAAAQTMQQMSPEMQQQYASMQYPPYGMQMPYPPMYYMPQQAAPEPKAIKTTKPAMPTFEEHTTILNEEQEGNLDLLMSVPVDVAVEIGRTRRRVKDILNYTKGSLVVLDRLAGDRADLYVNGKCIAKGDIVVVDDNFGLRIAEIIEPLALEDL
ncbi:flagellar motor switch protein FliN [Candidatus Agathobaculum pullicola]|uniref:flagellar motor switch protein FliN n=1 Tax=Candidatus Agathobaculum pullicola TaxID=2838426 RepID=UPI003F91D4E8